MWSRSLQLLTHDRVKLQHTKLGRRCSSPRVSVPKKISMKSTKAVSLIITIIHSLTFTYPIEANCSYSLKKFVLQTSECFEKWYEATNLTKPSTSTETITENCASAADQKARCVGKALADCRRENPTISGVLEIFVNPRGISGAIRVLCTPPNVEALTANKACIGEQDTGVNQCLLSQISGYKSKWSNTKVTSISRGRLWFIGEAQKILCDYQRDVSKCLSAYRWNCGDRIGDIFDALHFVTVPSVCGIKQTIPSRATERHIHVLYVVLLWIPYITMS